MGFNASNRPKRYDPPSASRHRRKIVLYATLVLLYLYFVRRATIPIPLLYPNEISNPSKYRRCDFLDAPAHPGPPSRRVAILSFQKGMQRDLVAKSVANKRRYADLHGYDLFTSDAQILDDEYPPAWSKFDAILDALETHDLVVWMDVDAIVMNTTVKLTDVADRAPESSLIFSHDQNGLNSGVFIVRSDAYARAFLRRCIDLKKQLSRTDLGLPFKYEQRALHYLFGSTAMDAWMRKRGIEIDAEERAETRRKIALVPHCALNANPCEEIWTAFFLFRASPAGDWFCANEYKLGDFIAHVAGKEPKTFKAFLVKKMAELGDAIFARGVLVGGTSLRRT